MPPSSESAENAIRTYEIEASLVVGDLPPRLGERLFRLQRIINQAPRPVSNCAQEAATRAIVDQEAIELSVRPCLCRVRAFEAVMMGDRLSNKIRPPRVLGSKKIRAAPVGSRGFST